MGQYRDIPVTVEVRQVPFVLFSVDPLAVVVDQGSSDATARFVVTVTPEEGYILPTYLEVINLAGAHVWDVNPIPAGGGKATVTIDAGGFPLGITGLTIRASEDVPIDYPDFGTEAEA